MTLDEYDRAQIIDCNILTDIVNFLDDLENLSVFEENRKDDIKKAIDSVEWLSNRYGFQEGCA